MAKIVLIGDSVLDNFYWLANRKHDLKYELTNLGYKVDNFAVDESRLTNIIHGIVPKNIYKETRYDQYPCSSDGYIYPIKLLKHSNSDMCVLSVGGTDLRVNLWRLTMGIDYLLDSVFNNEFIDNLNDVVTNIKALSPKLLLIGIYMPYLGYGSSYLTVSKYKTPVINRSLQILQSIAQKHNIPILDLSRTFDSNNRYHYGSSEIEPSNLSNICIADCIDYIYRNYNGYGVYYAPNCSINNIQIERPIVNGRRSACTIL